MTRWAARLAVTDQRSLTPLRGKSGLRCALVADSVWITGTEDDNLCRTVRRALPAADHFEVFADNLLRQVDRRVPAGFLPDVDWQRIAEFVDIELPLAALAGRSQERVELRLRRGDEVCDPTALLTTLPVWTSYATGAPEVRLQRWQFAVCGGGRVLVTGVPLPPIPGERLVLDEGIAVSAGWTWSPAVEAAVLFDLLALEANDVALLRPEGASDRIAVERIRGDEFAAASRSAARASAEGVSDAVEC